MHGGPSPGAPKGNKNAFKDGRYTAEALARRRDIAKLFSSIKGLLGEVRWVASRLQAELRQPPLSTGPNLGVDDPKIDAATAGR